MSEDQTLTTPPAPRHNRLTERGEVVPLEWPIEYAGRIITEITVRRPTVAEIGVWSERMRVAREAGFDASKMPHLPMFDVSDEVLGALDPDDEDRLEEVALRFLPRRFRAVAN